MKKKIDCGYALDDNMYIHIKRFPYLIEYLLISLPLAQDGFLAYLLQVQSLLENTNVLEKIKLKVLAVLRNFHPVHL